MKKRLFAVLAAICVITLALSACGSSQGGNAPAGSSAGGASAGGASAGGKTVSGEAYDTGSFTFNLPSGWSAVEVEDIFGDKDENGNAPIDPNTILVVKGEASDELEAVTKPFIRIYYSSGGYLSSKSFYDDAKDITVSLNGKEIIESYEGDSLGYFYQFIILEEGDGHFECSVLKSLNDKDTGISADDPEVIAILESLKAN